MPSKNPANPGQQKALQRIDSLKKKLLGTDREDHWLAVLDMEREIKRELLKKDLTSHKGLKLLIDWMMGQVKDANELLTIAKSSKLSDAERDGLIERVEFITAMIRFLDPKGKRLAELNKELEYQLEEPEEESDEIPDDMMGDVEPEDEDEK